MELAGLEPATSWVRSRRSRVVSLAYLQGISLLPAVARRPDFVRSLREIAGVPSRGRAEVMKLIGRLRPLFVVEAERGEIGTGVNAVPGTAGEAWAEECADGIRAVGDHWNVVAPESSGEPMRSFFAGGAVKHA
jgi:hypothetical protein